MAIVRSVESSEGISSPAGLVRTDPPENDQFLSDKEVALLREFFLLLDSWDRQESPKQAH
jgi:hypothetical protein